VRNWLVTVPVSDICLTSHHWHHSTQLQGVSFACTCGTRQRHGHEKKSQFFLVSFVTHENQLGAHASKRNVSTFGCLVIARSGVRTSVNLFCIGMPMHFFWHDSLNFPTEWVSESLIPYRFIVPLHVYSWSSTQQHCRPYYNSIQ